LELTQTILTKFGFSSYELMLSTRPDKAVGSDEIWEKATAALRGALERKGWDYTVDEGGGARDTGAEITTMDEAPPLDARRGNA